MKPSKSITTINLLLVVLFSFSCQGGVFRKKDTHGLIIDQKIIVDSLKREFDIFQPSNLKPNTKYPLVLSLHGHMGSKEYNSGTSGKKSPHKIFREIGEKEKFFIIYPQGEKGGDKKRGWNGCRADAKSNPETNDTKFISELIDYMLEKYPIDAKRVYVVGTSNGGEMASRLATEIPEKLTAAAVVVFSGPAQSECITPTKPISMLFMNGTVDPLAPYEGGKVGKDDFQRGTILSVKDAITVWLNVNNISQPPVIKKLPDINTDDKSHVEVYTYHGGKDNTEVVHYKVIGGGHTEPSIKEQMNWLYLKIVGPQNKDMEFAEEVWNFFKTKSR